MSASTAPTEAASAARAASPQARIRAHVRRALDVLCEPGSVHELRILHTPRDGTVAGYFDNLDKLADAALEWDGRAPGVYVTVNPTKPELLARAANRAKIRARETTSDADVVCRLWIIVDVDPVRASGISSTEAEHESALAGARALAAWLPSIGIAAASVVLIDSGNGAHVWIRVALPNDAASLDLVRRCLAALDLKFSTAVAKVDLTTCNAARIIKLPGTMAKKGDPTPHRPHRPSGLLDVPATIIPAPREALEALAALAPQPERPTSRANGSNGAPVDVEAFLGRHGLDVAFSAAWNGGTKWVLAVCPFNAEHTNRSALIGQFPSGATFFKCHHDGCRGKGWAELRALYGEASRTPPDGVSVDDLAARVANAVPVAKPDPVATATTKTPPLNVGTARRPALVTVGAVAPERVEWLWANYVPMKKISVIEGDPAAGKTFVALALAAAVSRGAPLPDPVDGIPRGARPPRDVVYLTCEDGVADTIRPRLDRFEADVSRIHVLQGIARADGGADGVTLCDLDVIGAAIDQTGAALLIVDPLQGFLGATVDFHRANEVRPVLAALSRMAERLGVAVLIVRHLSKAKADRAAYRGMGSIDITAAARSVLLAGRDPQDPLRRALVQTKMSLAAEGCALGYTIGDEGFLWTGKVDLTAAQLLAPDPAAPPSARDDAADFLQAALADGPHRASEMYSNAEAAGITKRTLQRALATLKVRVEKRGFQGHWWWALPPEERQTAKGCQGVQEEKVATFEGRGDLGAADGRAGATDDEPL